VGFLVHSTNRGLEENVKQGVKMLTVDIEKTPFYQIGVEKGVEKGKIEERFDNAILMIKEFQLAIDDVVQKLNIKKEELLEYMKKKKEEA
jgi:hypothetical protein